MNLLNRTMYYDKTKCTNQENCNCEECIPSNEETIKNQALKEYPSLSEKEIEEIINERYFYKDEKTKEFIRDALRVHGDRYDYSESIYTKFKSKIKIICRVDGHPSFEQNKDHHVRRKQGCWFCGRIISAEKQRLGTENFIIESKKIHGDLYKYDMVKYITNQTPVKIYCTKCKKYFSQTPEKHLSGRGCWRCGGTKKYTTEEFIETSERKYPHLFGYDRVNYISADELIEIKCLKCNKYFHRTPRRHLYLGNCPICTKSKGEDFIEDWLLKHNIKFIQQKSFDGCKYKQKLNFDFYIPSKNMCIEYDGEFHFQAIRKSKSMTQEQALKNLEESKIRDNIKNEFCKNKGINLIRIKYDEDLEERLCKIFNEYLTLFDL